MHRLGTNSLIKIAIDKILFFIYAHQRPNRAESKKILTASS